MSRAFSGESAQEGAETAGGRSDPAGTVRAPGPPDNIGERRFPPSFENDFYITSEAL